MYNRTTIDKIAAILIENGETMAVAESVTAGHLQAALSLSEGATEFFQGGVTAYNLKQKTRLLHVDPLHAVEVNCVSVKVAEQMAENAHKLFNADWSIATTGYAAAVPDAGVTELFCFFSIASKGEIVISERIDANEKDPLKVQTYYADTILQKFCTILVNHQR